MICTQSQKQLQKTFIGKGEVRGMVFKCIIANPQAFIYKVDNQGSEYYEVFLHKIDARFGQVRYPRSKAFGVWAWSFTDLNRAMAKFNEISAQSRQPKEPRSSKVSAS